MKTFSCIMISIFLALPLTGSAQRLWATGSSVEELVPEGWTYTHAQGDINKDGIADVVIIATPNDEDQMEVREDGYVLNYNMPYLDIFLGNADGSYSIMKEYNEIMEGNGEGVSINHSVEITDKGVIKITVSNFYSMGSWEQPTATYVIRLQNGDFYLIGKETDSFARNSGEAEKVSFNYLTRKCQRITYNAMDDSVTPKERWSNLPKKPLEKLGSFSIVAY